MSEPAPLLIDSSASIRDFDSSQKNLTAEAGVSLGGFRLHDRSHRLTPPPERLAATEGGSAHVPIWWTARCGRYGARTG